MAKTKMLWLCPGLALVHATQMISMIAGIASLVVTNQESTVKLNQVCEVLDQFGMHW